MENQNLIPKLKSIVLELLDIKLDVQKQKDNIDTIHTYFKELTNISGYEQNIENLAAIPTARGKALGLNHAAQCLLDYNRTVKFLRAVVMTIKEKLQKNPNQPVSIFYAGCGPYAPFMSLIAPLFTPNEINFSLLEINQNSLLSVKKLIKNLNLNNYKIDFYEADAITFNVSNAANYDILISETLDALLYRESYVPILFNLLPQFSENIKLIPENVIVEFNLKSNNTDEEKNIEILNVRKALALNNQSEIPKILAPKQVDLASINIDKYDNLFLDTRVIVQNDIELTRNESSLTIPLKLNIEPSYKDKKLIFQYHMDDDIELKCFFN